MPVKNDNDPIYNAALTAVSGIKDLERRVEGLGNSSTISVETKEKFSKVLEELKSVVLTCNQTLMKSRLTKPENIKDTEEPSAGPNFNKR